MSTESSKIGRGKFFAVYIVPIMGESMFLQIFWKHASIRTSLNFLVILQLAGDSIKSYDTIFVDRLNTSSVEKTFVKGKLIKKP